MIKLCLHSALTVLLLGCSHYATISYRVPGNSQFQLPKDSVLTLIIPKESGIEEEVQQQIHNIFEYNVVSDAWLKVAEKKQDNLKDIPNVLTVVDFKISSQEGASHQWQSEDKTLHSSTYDGMASMKLQVKMPKFKVPQELMVEVSSQSSSEISLPPAPGRKSLRPLVNSLLGIDDERTRAVNDQKALLRDQLSITLKEKLIINLLRHLTPEKKSAEVKIMDGEKDMKPYVQFLARKEYELAYRYLTELNQTHRSDVLYNQALALEMQSRHQEACPLYEQAYKLEKNSDFLQLKIACEDRRDMAQLIGNSSNL